MYTFAFHELNGVGLTIDSLEACHFVEDTVHVRVFDGASLPDLGMENAVAPFGTWEMTGGLPVQEKVSGAAVKLNVTDDTGAKRSFTSYLELNMK